MGYRIYQSRKSGPKAPAPVLAVVLSFPKDIPWCAQDTHKFPSQSLSYHLPDPQSPSLHWHLLSEPRVGTFGKILLLIQRKGIGEHVVGPGLGL